MERDQEENDDDFEYLPRKYPGSENAEETGLKSKYCFSEKESIVFGNQTQENVFDQLPQLPVTQNKQFQQQPSCQSHHEQ